MDGGGDVTGAGGCFAAACSADCMASSDRATVLFAAEDSGAATCAFGDGNESLGAAAMSGARVGASDGSGNASDRVRSCDGGSGGGGGGADRADRFPADAWGRREG